MLRPRLIIAGVTGAAAVVLAGAYATRPPSTPAQSPTSAHEPILPSEAPAPRTALQSALLAEAQSYGEPVGLAVAGIEEGWVEAVNGDTTLPQQSVSKLWVALALFEAVDRGALALDDPVTFTDADRSVFHQPIIRDMTAGVLITTYRDLVRRAIVESDNAANDKLLRALGGEAGVMATLMQKGLRSLRVGGEERVVQAQIAGLTWREEFGYGASFNKARSRLSSDARDEARSRYLAAPLDGASPNAIVDALARLQRRELLSPDSTAHLLGLMEASRTGPRRLRAGQPPSWRLAHKTGTGQDLAGSSIGINDVGVLIAPDGRAYAVAVMIPKTAKPVPERQVFMQRIAAAVVAEWERSHGDRAMLAQNGEGGPSAKDRGLALQPQSHLD